MPLPSSPIEKSDSWPITGTLLSALLFWGATANATTLRVQVEGARTPEGKAVVLVFKEKAGFPNDRSKAHRVVEAPIQEGQALATFTDLEPGKYSVGIYHDANSNSEMDTNWIGMPKEGVGVSNNAKARMGPPKFEDALIDIKADTEIRIPLKYL